MNEKKDLINMNGETIAVEVLAYIENTTTTKKYIYYTMNETVGAGPSGTVKIYVSKLKQDDLNLDGPITDEDWDMLKSVMSDSIKGTVSANIKYLPLSQLTNNTSVSDRAIAMPISYDYISKQKAIYEQNASADTPLAQEPVTAPTPEATVTPTTENTVEPVFPVQPPVQETPSVEPTVEPVPVEQPINNLETPESDTTTSENASGRSLEPIDIAQIETKYTSMIEEINNLKEKEIEAAKRYNATLELTNMHSEQHANYVQNDIKENIQSTSTIQETSIPTVEPTELVNNHIVEPAPVTPVVPEPTPTNTATPTNLETNWFDMPNK